MSKNKKLKESSLASDIKGFLSTAKMAVVKRGDDKKSPKTKGEKPWYLKSLNEIKQEVVHEIAMLKEASAEEINQKEKDLQRQYLAAKEASRRDPSDIGKQLALKSAEDALNRFNSLSPEEKQNFDRYLIDPNLRRSIDKRTEKDLSEPKKRRDIDPNIVQFSKSSELGEVFKIIDPKVTSSIMAILAKYFGYKETREEEYENIKDFVENVFYKKYHGLVDYYIKEKSEIWRNITYSEIKDENLQQEIEKELTDNNVPFRSLTNFQDWTKLSKPLQDKIREYYKSETEHLNHVIRQEFSKMPLPKMTVSKSYKKTQKLNPYTKSKQEDDETPGE